MTIVVQMALQRNWPFHERFIFNVLYLLPSHPYDTACFLKYIHCGQTKDSRLPARFQMCDTSLQFDLCLKTRQLDI